MSSDRWETFWDDTRAMHAAIRANELTLAHRDGVETGRAERAGEVAKLVVALREKELELSALKTQMNQLMQRERDVNGQ